MRCSTSILCVVLSAIVSEVGVTARGQANQPPQRAQRQFGAPQNQPPPQRPAPNMGDLMRMLAPPPGSDNDMYDNGPRRYQEETPQPAPVPSQQEVARMSNEQLQRTVRRAVSSLDDDLDNLPTGDQWRKHFDLAGLACTAWRDPPGAADAPARGQLQSMAKRINEARRQPEYQALAQMWGVRALDVLLPEYALGPLGRSHRDLTASTRQLDESLGRMDTGAGWQQFLDTKKIQQLPAAQRDLTLEESDQVRALAKRYDDVAKQSQYAAISRLPAFRLAHANLQQFVAQVNALANNQLNPQPEPPGSGKVLQLNPQPEPPGAGKVLQLNPQPEPPGSGKVLQLNPQPEPPGAGKVLQLNPQPEPPGSGKVLQLNPQPEPPGEPTQKGSESNPQPKPPG